MKKLFAIILAALMILTVLPMGAFAKVSNNDQIMTEILNGEYRHYTYTKDDNNYFKTPLGLMTAFNASKWVPGITGSDKKAAAETILIGLIDRIEAELNNETYEKILSVLQGASTVAGLVEKVDSVTGVLDLAENSTWASSLTALNTTIKVMNFANDEYEKYMQAYAVILSCQAASIYYGDFLQYLIDNCTTDDTKPIKQAAEDLKENIAMNLEDASSKLLEELAKDVAGEATLIAADFAMDTNSVTAIIKTVYKTGSSIGEKLFNTTDRYEYMTGLATLARIEEVIPPYINSQIRVDDENAVMFAKIAMLTLRETGETMLSNLGKVIADSTANQLFNKTEEASALVEEGSVRAIKLGVYRDIILADADYTSKLIRVDYASGQNLTIHNDAEDYNIVTLRNGKESKYLDTEGAFYCVYNGTIYKYVRVIVTFIDGCSFITSASSSSSSSSSSGSSSGGGFFAQLFAAIAAFFKSLFSFGK